MIAHHDHLVVRQSHNGFMHQGSRHVAVESPAAAPCSSVSSLSAKCKGFSETPPARVGSRPEDEGSKGQGSGSVRASSAPRVPRSSSHQSLCAHANPYMDAETVTVIAREDRLSGAAFPPSPCASASPHVSPRRSIRPSFNSGLDKRSAVVAVSDGKRTSSISQLPQPAPVLPAHTYHPEHVQDSEPKPSSSSSIHIPEASQHASATVLSSSNAGEKEECGRDDTNGYDGDYPKIRDKDGQECDPQYGQGEKIQHSTTFMEQKKDEEEGEQYNRGHDDPRSSPSLPPLGGNGPNFDPCQTKEEEEPPTRVGRLEPENEDEPMPNGEPRDNSQGVHFNANYNEDVLDKHGPVQQDSLSQSQSRAVGEGITSILESLVGSEASQGAEREDESRQRQNGTDIPGLVEPPSRPSLSVQKIAQNALFAAAVPPTPTPSPDVAFMAPPPSLQSQWTCKEDDIDWNATDASSRSDDSNVQ